MAYLDTHARLYQSCRSFVPHARLKSIKAKENTSASLIENLFKPIKANEDLDIEERTTLFPDTPISFSHHY